MKFLPAIGWQSLAFAALAGLAIAVAPSLACAAISTNEFRIVALQGLGKVEILTPGSTDWVPTQTNQILHQHWRLRTGPNSRVTLMSLSDQSIVPLGPLSEVEITDGEERGLFLFRGILSFFHRGKPGWIRIKTRSALAGIKGTEFVIEVTGTGDTESTTLSVIDGEVSFSNEQGALELTNDQQAIAEFGKAPRPTRGFIAKNIVQWCFYYPAVLDLRDLPLTAEEEKNLSESLVAYRAGDLLAALAKHPEEKPGSTAERIYYAALLLSVGQAQQSEDTLAALSSGDTSERIPRLATALRTLIAAVKREKNPSLLKPQLATELLAASYYEQSLADRKTSLPNALHLAKQAATASPEFGFAWERVAELEFSFGRTARALEALNKSLALAPRNAQAIALKGFLLAAQNKIGEATHWFNQAIATDSALGNAWLGRGLCRIRRGDTIGGREDLLIAAALEPQRSTLRSYLGKAWSDAGDDQRARKEFELAQKLDDKDPTSWLYSALNNEQHNRINEAIRDLEKSQELNDNRTVYRSGVLLDQDRAVRSANLARIYADAGMEDVALREASHAVAADYGNFSAHLFLANSYEQLRQQNSFDLRYETPAFSEYLIASLLGPPDGRILAQPVTQQEYTRLFERDSFGFSSSTEYLSRGAWNQYAAQYGTFRNSSYAVETGYRRDPGQTPNGSVETKQISLKVKEMLTPRDGLFFQVTGFQQDNGDLSQRYDANQADLGLHISEKQAPDILVGLDHQWNESQHTLLLASRFNDSLSIFDPRGRVFLSAISGNRSRTNFVSTDLTQNLRNRLTVDSFELQHLAHSSRFETIAGIRFQYGTYHLFNKQFYDFNNNADFDPNDPIDWATSYFVHSDQTSYVTNQSFQVHSVRVTPYWYENWQVADSLWLIGGVAYDYQSQPVNAIFAPLDDAQEVQRQLSPKAGLIWTPSLRSSVRAAYSKSLGGASLDQSVRLEPTQLAGFAQAYRSLIPDALAGGIGGAHFETANLSVEQRFASGTYFAVSAQLLRSTADHSVGTFLHDVNADGSIIQVNERLRFQERSAEASVHQLLGDYFNLAFRYRLTDARLTAEYPAIGPSQGLTFQGITNSTSRGILHLVGLNGGFQHPSGVFASAEGQWWAQELRGSVASLSGDHFWQANLMAGYRSPRRHFEVSVGLLNVTGQNYRLYPINLYPDLPRQRTFVTRLQLNF